MTTADDDGASGPAVHLHLHAYPTILVAGQVVELPLKGGLALIARLAAAPGRLARAAAAALLWPDAEGGVARARLRRLMHDVNRRLGVDLLAGDADTLWLAPTANGLRCDWAETRRLARRALHGGDLSPEDAAPLLRRDAHRLLDGFVLGADTFADWLEENRRELAAQVAQALERLVAQWLDQGHTRAALAAAARLVQLDPCAEAGYAGLMAAHARHGDAAGVAAAYFDCAERLRHELGVRPSAAFERLHAEALSACARAGDRPAFLDLRVRPAPAGHAIAAAN